MENNLDTLSASERREAAQNQLQLVLSFFPRVDGLLSVVLGLDLAMLGVGFSRTPPPSAMSSVQVLFLLAFLACEVASLVCLYRGSFPNLDGGIGSLVYFRGAAGKDAHEYVSLFSARSSSELASDLLYQAWRNSCILTAKFDRLKLAYRWMAASAAPWVIVLLVFPNKSG
jgi:hypothetical protein